MYLLIMSKNIYGLGWGSKRFQRYKAFHEVKGMGHAPRGVQRDPRSGSLRGGDLNGF